VVVIAAVFTLARFSEAFLVLRAQELGLGLVLIPLVLVVLNVVYALSSYPVGVLADRFAHGTLLALGVLVLVLSDLALAFVGGLVGLALGVALWGLHMGMTQGLLAASVVAGGLWDTFGSRATFLAGAGFAIMALLALVPVARRARRNRPAPH
jgi:sugar phosphate permease